ncbi:MAG: NAD(P)-binding domain-containing protein, partial [Anaerolineales bacterium]|nr:NAD(P)-binding domain-containing protein [Anaerolineales bacterium]
MQIGMVGLGKMGGNMTSRLLTGGHEVLVFDRNKDAIGKAESEGAFGAESLEDLVSKLTAPRVVWIMVPAGDPTESLLNELGELLVDGDTAVDGGNSNYKDTKRRAAELKEKGIALVDVGTSGGVWGLAEGYSMMIGGDASKVNQLQPVFETLAPGKNKGWGHVGDSGAGHFVKMIHNGIEYG